MWSSYPIQILRFAADEGEIRRGDDYLIVSGDERGRKFEMPIGAEDVYEYLDDLRYVKPSRSEEQRTATRRLITDTVTRMLDVRAPKQPLQLDLIVNAKEIAALPFESALADDGQSLLVDRATPLVLTRRIRGAFQEHGSAWPAKPRILFVAAQPLQEVPLAEHVAALRDALQPWVEPLKGVPEAMRDESTVLTQCVPGSLAGIAELCRRAAEPFTHVHILAHGVPIDDRWRRKFGLQLASEDGRGADNVSAEKLVEALSAGGSLPTVVTLAACDSGNEGLTSVSGSSPAHALHATGIPVVLASQYPLTWEGSATVARVFYRSLLTGSDVRDAIYAARQALFAREEQTQHDWMSLIAFARLPEGYADQLLDVGLAAELAALEAADQWGKHLVEHGVTAPERFAPAIDRLQERIDALERRVVECQAVGRDALLTESRGLLGSAHKRLAELLFSCTATGPESDGWIERSRRALDQSSACYAAAFADDLSDSWVGVQALALEAVVHGRIGQPWRWHAAMHAAAAPSQDDREVIWRCGSRAELALLAPYAGEPRQLEAARAALGELKALSPDPGSFPVVSTRRQLERYTTWWTSENGFFASFGDLRGDVEWLLTAAGLRAG
jgi:hypothetical protein